MGTPVFTPNSVLTLQRKPTLADVWSYAASPHFSPRERLALGGKGWGVGGYV